MRRLTVVFDAPPVEVSPNKVGIHWGRVKRAKEATKSAAVARLHQAMMAQFGRRVQFAAATIESITWRVGGGRNMAQVCRPKDEDNAIAMLKATFDAFKAVGLVPDDKAKYLTGCKPDLVKGDDTIEMVVVEREAA